MDQVVRVDRVAAQGSPPADDDPGSAFDDTSRKRSPASVLQHGVGDGNGFISGHFFMTWAYRPKAKLRAIIEADKDIGSTSEILRFEVFFYGACTDFFDQLCFKTRDRVFLSLKEAQLVLLENTVMGCTIPMQLHYTKGVLMKIVPRACLMGGEAKIVNTWGVKELAQDEAEEWFPTPVHPRRQLTKMDIPCGRVQGAIKSDHLPLINEADVRDSEAAQTDAGSASSGNHNSEIKPQRLNAQSHGGVEAVTNGQLSAKKQTKKQARLLKRAQRNIATDTPVVAKILETEPIPGPSQEKSRISSSPFTPQFTSTLQPPPTHIEKNDRKPSLTGPIAMQAGTVTELGRYRPLKSLKLSTDNNFIGVVRSTSSPSMTRVRDWMVNIKMVDPSIVDPDILAGGHNESFHINLFTKKYMEWLPCPAENDILILHKIRIVDFNGETRGTGYHGKMRWAIFDPAKGKIHHGARGNVPDSMELAPGSGYVYSPFIEPGEGEIRYCTKLADWWRAIQEKMKKDMGSVNQIGGGPPQERYTRRQHRLICDAGPDVPPSGFFDCTIEVVHRHTNDNGVISLYVTDYTKNSQVVAVQGAWCLPQLGDYILKIELWDSAADVGRTMAPGEYYALKNVRMKVSKGGYVEGTLSAPKILKMLEEDAGVNPQLEALLKRKKQWRETEAVNSFEHCFMRDITTNQFFNCSVEVLHAIRDSSTEPTCLFVTDYTPHSDFPPFDEPWVPKGLSGHIVKIILRDAQVDMAQAVQVGSYYSIEKLRIQKSAITKQFQGSLGGSESLIHLLNPRNTSNESLSQLLRHKEEWQAEGQPMVSPADARPRKSPCPRPEGQRFRHKNLPNKFRLVAKIVDFWPLQLHDCVSMFCSNCKSKACFSCDGIDHGYVRRIFRFFFLLQDENGDQLRAVVSDDCPLLDGLERADLRATPPAYAAFCQRLKPLIGNLLDVHEALQRNEVVDPKTLDLIFIIGTWNMDEGGQAFSIESFEGKAEG
ncbi:hypothetical protein BD779DRAFT_1513799 [Infundibulicybe gibba]|nr:hypothetical protein BD779DRAFT_1513799 [Infundibulicybe gibba]